MRATGLWLGSAIEYGSGTPMGHGGAGHEHAAGDADHAHVQSSGGAAPRARGISPRVCRSASISCATRTGGAKLTLQLDVENIANNIYLIAQEGEFSPAQFSIPRLLSVTAKFRF